MQIAFFFASPWCFLLPSDAWVIPRTRSQQLQSISLAKHDHHPVEPNIVNTNDNDTLIHDPVGAFSTDEQDSEILDVFASIRRVSFNSRSSEDADEDIDATRYERTASLYNSAPLVTGVIITGFSLFLTFYGFYAGLSGTDPLFQQYPIN